MKNLILLFILALLYSCGPSGVGKLISDYEQTIGSTKTDLNFKVQKLEKIRNITVRDSLRYIQFQLNKAIQPDSRYIDSSLTFSEAIKMADQMEDLTGKTFVASDEITKFEAKKEYRNWVRTNLEVHNLKFTDDIYKGQDTSKILAYIYKCTYTIKNPFLNGAKQEITNTYLINQTLTEIIKKEAI